LIGDKDQVNTKFRKGRFRDSKHDHPADAELRGYIMESDFTHPETRQEFKQIDIITDTKGPLFELSPLRRTSYRFLVDGTEPYPDLKFALVSTSYHPGLDETTTRLESKYGTWDERVQKRLRRHNMVYVFRAFQPRPVMGIDT
jgi:hypothetical protein